MKRQKSAMKFTQKKRKELKELKNSDLIAYIDKLHKLLKRSARKLHKYKDKFRELAKKQQLRDKEQHEDDSDCRDADVTKTEAKSSAAQQVVKKEEAEDEDGVDVDDDAAAATAAFDFVAEIRQVAEQAQNLNGFVYEPTSGLYYDQKTGYYYNAEYGLYYDGNNGCYYSYNQEKKSFEFHSQVPVQATKASDAHQHDDDDDGHYNNDRDGDDDDDVEFDEFGVITDKMKLQKIKEHKQKLKDQKTRYKAQHSKKTKQKHTHTTQGKNVVDTPAATKRHRKTHKSKKRKHQRHSSDATSEKEHSDADRTETQTARKRQARCAEQRKVPVGEEDEEEFEDGELSSSSSSSSSSGGSGSNSDSDTDAGVPLFKAGSSYQDIAKKYPPSLRVIVQETNLDELKVGSLSLITFKGGTLGREGNHDVLIPDLNVSKCHLKFTYETKEGIYKVVDLGSQNGTVLNGVRMSAAKSASIAHDLVHGSVIQVNQTKLLCHVHEGNSTCGLCEPGLLIESATRDTSSTAASAPVMLTHKEQLKKLQKKYGLENEKFVDAGGKQATGNYNDRAATRRTEVGSSTDKEKTQTASVDTAIPSENKGFKMLSKLGWNKGEALGKSTAGLLEPINVSGNTGTTGLGCENRVPSVQLTHAEKKKIAAWKKAQERYEKTTDIFGISDDDELR